VVVDLAVPRNVDPAVGRLPAVSLIDLDSLNPKIAEVEQARLDAVTDAESIIEEEIPSFSAWLSARQAGEALEPLRSAILAICQREVAYATDEAAAARTASRIVAKIMAGPMEEMRERMRAGAPVEPIADVMRSLFPEVRA
jgi:glutamyl-tRNA reductase